MTDVKGDVPIQARAQKLDQSEVIMVYTNHSVFGMSKWDIQILLGFVEPRLDGQPIIHHIANVVMSPQHAKAFFNAMKTNLEAYEKNYGAIPQPPDVQFENAAEALTAATAEEVPKEESK